jgi:multiple sugar transport system substrate-binding protein
MRLKKWITMAVLAATLLAACQPRTVVVKERVTRVVEVEKEVTRIVAATPVVQKVVETRVVKRTVVVTATPAPTADPYSDQAPIEVWVDAARLPQLDAWREAHPDKADLIHVTQANRGEVANQILLWNNIGEGWPDVVFAEPYFGALWSDAAHDFVSDLSDWVPAEVIATYGENLSGCWYAGRLICLRHDLAQMVLWYDKSVVDELGVEFPETWEDFKDVAEYIHATFPDEGYVIGSVATSNEWLFRASECPMVYEEDLGHVRIFDPDDPRCVRAAELLDRLWELGVLLPSPYGSEILGKFGNRVAFLPHASWYGQHVIRPNYPEDLQAAGRVGAALLPKWVDQAQRWTGTWGGGGWVMSKHTQNPRLASELIVWLSTGPWHETDATTFPAYPPTNKVWGEALASDSFYAKDPYPVLEEMAPLIWPGISQGRMYLPWWSEYDAVVAEPLVSGERTVVESLPLLRERLFELAGPAGFEVLE